MQFSGSGLHGKAALEYIKAKQSGQIETTISSNVSKEADRAFMQELKRTDLSRYDRLIANIQKSTYAHARRPEPADRHCSCGASLTGKRQGSKWCSDTCRMRIGPQNNPKKRIQNKGVAATKIGSLLVPHQKACQTLETP